ncbi:MAG: hypothetical protein OXU94_01325 [Gammaproteobacteria bacterium]|nr:hypothetical protein [Gammaproteobacteria bacterium]
MQAAVFVGGHGGILGFMKKSPILCGFSPQAAGEFGAFCPPFRQMSSRFSQTKVWFRLSAKLQSLSAQQKGLSTALQSFSARQKSLSTAQKILSTKLQSLSTP